MNAIEKDVKEQVQKVKRYAVANNVSYVGALLIIQKQHEVLQ